MSAERIIILIILIVFAIWIISALLGDGNVG